MDIQYAVGTVIGFFIAFSPTALSLVASSHLSKKSVEEWKLLAWVPPVPLVAWWAYFAIAIIRDPTSHNLWPFEMIAWGLVTGFLFVVFLIGRKLAASSAPTRPWQH